jgi:hypothetical protein
MEESGLLHGRWLQLSFFGAALLFDIALYAYGSDNSIFLDDQAGFLLVAPYAFVFFLRNLKSLSALIEAIFA